MIKRQVLHRADVKTVYSSERQERMKVYFELTEKYNECLEPCKLQPAQMQPICQADCEKIYDQYKNILKDRYIDGNEHRLGMEVSNSQLFTTRRRPDRAGWFYDIFGIGWGEFIGNPTQPTVKPEMRV